MIEPTITSIVWEVLTHAHKPLYPREIVARVAPVFPGRPLQSTVYIVLSNWKRQGNVLQSDGQYAANQAQPPRLVLSHRRRQQRPSKIAALELERTRLFLARERAYSAELEQRINQLLEAAHTHRGRVNRAKQVISHLMDTL